MVIGSWKIYHQKPKDLANFGIIIGGSESHQSATDFPTDPRGGKT